MKFSQITTRYGNRYKQRVGAILHNAVNIFNTSSVFSISGVNGTITIMNSTDIKFTTNGELSNTRVMVLIPKEKFVENKSYTLSFTTDFDLSTITIGTATNANDTTSYTKYLDYRDKPVPQIHRFTIDTIDKDNVCIYFYFSYAPANKTINIKNITIK